MHRKGGFCVSCLGLVFPFLKVVIPSSRELLKISYLGREKKEEGPTGVNKVHSFFLRGKGSVTGPVGSETA